MTKNYEEMSKQILELLGGRENVTRLTHCVTRLRFTVKEKQLVQEKAIEKLEGVFGSQWLGEQYQVIVGAMVEEIYPVICKTGGFDFEAPIDENLDADAGKGQKKTLSFKGIGNKILAYLSPTMTGIIPMMIAACMCKTIAALLGPSLLNVISDTGDLYLVLEMMYNAFFYFMPMFLGYSAAKVLNISPMYGIYLGALIMAPNFAALVGARESLSVFGISSPVADYSSTFLPVILGVWIMSWVLKFFNRYIPNALKTIFVPLLTIIVMAPVMFAVCAPLGTYIGNVVGNFFIYLSGQNVIICTIAATVLAILLPYMVLGGMHGALVNFAILTFTTNGFETFLLPIMLAYNFAVFGVALGAFLRLKKPENKTAVLGCFISGILGSVTEPCLYGVIVKYKQTMKALLVSCAIAGLLVGILQPVYHVMTSATAFTFWIPWVAGGTANLVKGVILMLASLASGTVVACLVSYDEA